MNLKKTTVVFSRPGWLALAAMLLVSAMGASAANIRDGMVAYWPMNTITTGATPDACFTNTMTAGLVSPTVTAGQFGNALTLNGTSHYVTNAHGFDSTATGLPIHNTGTYTIAFWVKGANQVNKYVFTESGQNGGGIAPLFLIQSGAAGAKLDIYMRHDASTLLLNHVISVTTVFDNTWHHVAFVDNKGTCQLYVDGVLDGANFNYTPAGNFSMFMTTLGALVRGVPLTAPSGFFAGQLDDVAVWDRNLSLAEIQSVRTNSISTPITPLAPGIYAQPASQTRRIGDFLTLSVTAYGSRPYPTTYQWYKNGSPIPGATAYTNLISFVTTNDAGVYYCNVTNDIGATATTNFTITVPLEVAPSLTNGLVNYWPLDVITDDGSSLQTPELHFGHNLVLSNFTGTADVDAGISGVFGGVSVNYSNSLFFFSSTPRRYGIRTNGTPIYNATNYSVSMWVKGSFSGQNDARVFSEGSLIDNTPLFTFGTDSTAAGTAAMNVYIRGDTAPALRKRSTRPVFDGNWHHVVWTDANGDARLYIDGNSDETDCSYARPAMTLNGTMLGAVVRGAGPVNPSTANLDEVATWNRVLSWSEIQLIMTNGVPIPEGVVAPGIAVQPQQQTNNVFAGDTVSFNVQISGSLPVSLQWLKDGVAISGGVNPSALGFTLNLTNVQVIDSNTTYSVTAANSAGSVTSSIARLYVVPRLFPVSGTVLQADIAAAAVSDAQSGYQEFSLLHNPQSMYPNGVRMTISSINSAPLEDRHRPASAAQSYVTNAPPGKTQGSLWNDFIFANSTVDGAGLRIFIERLATNTFYGVTIWSFDSISTPARLSDWSETASGSPVILKTGYSFDGVVHPARDYDQTFGGLVKSSADGTLQIEGVRAGGTGAGVFFNAIRLIANPTGSRITRTEKVGSNLRVTVETEYPGQAVSLHQRGDLLSGGWADSGAAVIDTYGPVTVFEVPMTLEQMFYRAASSLP